MRRRTDRRLLYAGVAALLALITWLDYVTGEFGFFIFYFIPISLSAWYGSRRAAIVVAFASGSCWFLSDRLSLQAHSNELLIYWETLIRTISFLFTAWTLSHIRTTVERQRDVLHVVSHDLRSPLGALAGQAAILRKHVSHDAFATARVDAILRSASRIDAMIEDLVDSARSDSHQLRLQLATVDVCAHLSAFLSRSTSPLDVGRVRLRCDGDRPLLARADPENLNRGKQVEQLLVGI